MSSKLTFRCRARKAGRVSNPKLHGLGHAEAGYTLVELSVALLVAGLTAAITLTTFTLVAAGVARWQHSIRLENTLHVALRRVSTDLWYADVYPDEGGGAWLLVQPNGRRVRYLHQDGELLRNGHGFMSGELRVDHFDIASGAAPDSSAVLVIRVALSNQWGDVRGETGVAPRIRSRWTSPTRLP